MKKLKVIIACGSGAVTSTLCAGIITDIAKNNGINIEVTTTSAMELKAQMKYFDIKFTTMPYQFPKEEKYAMNIFPLITGINADLCKKQIENMLITAAEE